MKPYPYVFLVKEGGELVEKGLYGGELRRWKNLKHFPREWCYAKTYPFNEPAFASGKKWYWSVLPKKRVTVKYGTHSSERCWLYGDINIGEKVYICDAAHADYGVHVWGIQFRRASIYNINDNVIFVEAM